jgi:hypothetical protein
MGNCLSEEASRAHPKTTAAYSAKQDIVEEMLRVTAIEHRRQEFIR